jgi:hypothetical protein
MTGETIKVCIYPGCERPAVPPHPLGGPQPSFCDLEEHNALTAHQERRRRGDQGPEGAPAASDEQSATAHKSHQEVIE